MPYQIRKLPNSNEYTVRNAETGRIFAKGTTYEHALSLVRLLSAIGHNKHFVPYSNQAYRPKRKSSSRRKSAPRRKSSSRRKSTRK